MPDSLPRHLGLTIWLWLGIIVNTLTALYYLFDSKSLAAFLPGVTTTTFLLLAGLCVFNVACNIALLKWKKWGFWGICVTATLVAVVNINIHITSPIHSIVLGIISVLLLFAMLNVGKGNQAWPRLK